MPAAPTPTDILNVARQHAIQAGNQPFINNPSVVNNIEFICRFVQNRACVRLILACSLAKVTHPEVDIRKPYTEIGTTDCYSGRTYDEKYVASFVLKHHLPCNPTTAFLTPAFMSFLRHFLHLFYRLRMQFLEAYQELVLAENESAVRSSLKEALLALRLAAESANTFDEN
ncbi:MAG: hypothetical protein ACRDHZ_21665 [Ktedonobacteraceae bacterium]